MPASQAPLGESDESFYQATKPLGLVVSTIEIGFVYFAKPSLAHQHYQAERL